MWIFHCYVSLPEGTLSVVFSVCIDGSFRECISKFQPSKRPLDNQIDLGLAMVLQAQPCFSYMGVSKNNGTPKWMVHKGNPY